MFIDKNTNCQLLELYNFDKAAISDELKIKLINLN